MSTMDNTTPVVTTVTKPATKEKTPKEADATPRVNIQDFCEEHYEDIMSVIMDKICHDKQKEVHARLDFEESPKKRRIREGSQNSSARTFSTRDRSHGRTHPHRWDSSNRDRPRSRDRSVASKNHMIIPTPPMGQGPNMDTARDIDHSRHEKKERESESLSSRVSESGTSDGGH
ncbi:hypothetical protein Tco_0701145 [Tanacetum coccineum]